MRHFPFRKLLVVLIIIAGIPMISYLLWLFKSEKQMEVLVMNKTVTSEDRKEHKAVFWILNHNRFVRKNGETYDYKNDYYGFFPFTAYHGKEYEIKDISVKDIDRLSDKYDLAWIIDTYGLSFNDWYGYSASDTFPRMLYGGLTQNDYSFILEMLKKNKLVIIEFNFFSSPTSNLLRAEAENLLDIYWSGWTGMYYDNLDYTLNAALPTWIVDSYRKQNSGDWPYTKSGIILVHENNDIIVLENETHLDIETPMVITTNENADRYGVTTEVHYPHRFDVSYAADTSNVISYYELSVNSYGDRLLKRHNIPGRFPALTRNSENGKIYYLAGSFSEYDIPILSSCFQGAGELDFYLNKDKIGSTGSFFWTYYYPFISTVLSEYYDSL